MFLVKPVYANNLQIILNESNFFPYGESYANVSLSYIYDGDKRGVKLSVQANENILEPCNNFGIQRFGFNTTIQNPAENLIITLPPLWNRKLTLIRRVPEFFGLLQANLFNYSAFGSFEVDTRTVARGRVNPLFIEIFHVSDNLYLADFVVPNEDVKKELILILSKHLMYVEKPQRTFTDRVIDWLSNLIPDEEDTKIKIQTSSSFPQTQIPASL